VKMQQATGEHEWDDLIQNMWSQRVGGYSSDFRTRHQDGKTPSLPCLHGYWLHKCHVSQDRVHLMNVGWGRGSLHKQFKEQEGIYTHVHIKVKWQHRLEGIGTEEQPETWTPVAVRRLVWNTGLYSDLRKQAMVLYSAR
jgi:hypothetical protein